VKEGHTRVVAAFLTVVLTTASEMVGGRYFLRRLSNQTLQIRFHPDIRFRFRILTCDPDWTKVLVLKKKRSFQRF
jgi:hypothetical protein